MYLRRAQCSALRISPQKTFSLEIGVVKFGCGESGSAHTNGFVAKRAALLQHRGGFSQ
jgi:hypothetical protein